MRKILVYSFLFASCINALKSVAQTKLSTSQIRRLDSIALQDVPPDAPGIATAIIENGTVIYQQCGGFANLTDSARITPRTRFNIASNGKQFTALAILQLEKQGKIRLTDDIRHFLPALFPAVKPKMTIAHLLNHTSGIRDVYDLWSLQGLTWWEQRFANNDVYQMISKQQHLNFEPGTRYLYSNTNYILLAIIIEKVTGKTFVQYTAQLFKDLNMPNTSFVDDHTKIKGPIARAYFNFGEWTTYEWVWNVCGDGNLFTTLADQVQWEKVVQSNHKTAAFRGIIEKSQKTIENSPFTNYGYGLERGEYKSVHYVFHEGATGAWKATTMRFPEKKLTLITLTNTGKAIPSMQTRQMADIVLDLPEDRKYFPVSPAAVGPYIPEEDLIGTYLTSSGFSFQFDKEQGKLYLKRAGRNDVELVREADNIFHQKNDPAFRQEFIKDRNGVLQVTVYYTTHAPYSLKKVTALWANFDFTSLTGKYINEETNTLLDIHFQKDKTYSVKMGKSDTMESRLITPSLMLAGSYQLKINTHTATCDTIWVDGDRVKNIIFMRINSQ